MSAPEPVARTGFAYRFTLEYEPNSVRVVGLAAVEMTVLPSDPLESGVIERALAVDLLELRGVIRFRRVIRFQPLEWLDLVDGQTILRRGSPPAAQALKFDVVVPQIPKITTVTVSALDPSGRSTQLTSWDLATLLSEFEIQPPSDDESLS